MSSDIAIEAVGLGKLYRIGAVQESYSTLRDTLNAAALAPVRAAQKMFSRSKSTSDGESNEFWALKDISFQVRRGEVVGVIGQNGAGKSTLLKILTRITEPTEGGADIHGRVASLLEVGTGFHQELTGRENIYLNGAILGMKRAEIDRQFDEMVAFAEVEKFIDTPVKHYSSGMYLRLAFAVAAHLEPEILLIDEVLAVGDVAFQKKCMGKMENVAAQGRTVLFVSHNLAAIKDLCQTCIVLNQGRMDYRGPVVQGLARYGQQVSAQMSEHTSTGTAAGFQHLTINEQPSGTAPEFESGEPLSVGVALTLRDSVNNAELYCIIQDNIGNQIVHDRLNSSELNAEVIPPGRHLLTANFPPMWLCPGVYTVYFKFIGTNSQNQEARYFSDRAILGIIGKAGISSRSTLTPDTRWCLETVTPRDSQGTPVLSQGR